MQIDRMNKGVWGKVRAFFDVKTEEGFVVKGFKIIEGIEGLFVSFPSVKGNDEEYHDTVWCEKTLRQQLNLTAITEYDPDDPSLKREKGDKQTELVPAGDEDIPF